MDSPHLASVRHRTLLAAGTSGTVFRAEKADGSVVALKLLDGMAVNRQLLERAHRKLTQGPWPAGVMECLESDYRARPAVQITPCYADGDDRQRWHPRTLQRQLVEFPGERSWDVAHALAQSLSALHNRQVAHGNLKPGNVFFDDEGKLLVADWALGNMPDTISQGFTDAFLYQPPEQLRHPEGYLEGAGFRWDVFAFGVLAYRLLTGVFPRCHDTFSNVAPAPGEAAHQGINADLAKIAASLEAEPEVTWPEAAASELESQHRDIIQRCLALDPLDRPANAIELCREFDAARRAIEEKSQRDALLLSRRRAQRSVWQIGVAASLVTAALVMMVFLWQRAETRHQREVTQRKQDVQTLDAKLHQAKSQRTRAEKARAIAENNLAEGKAEWLNRLTASHQLGDQLFDWVILHAYPELPTLDDPAAQIPALEKAYQAWLDDTATLPEHAAERWRAHLHLAELALARGNPSLAQSRFQRAMENLDQSAITPALQHRLATCRVVLALEFQKQSAPATPEAFAAARRAVELLAAAEVRDEQIDYLAATLDLHESRDHAEAGRSERALSLLVRANRALNRLHEQRPDHVFIRSEMAHCQLSTASLLEGMGRREEARINQQFAIESLKKIIAQSPGDPEAKVDLAGCYGRLASNAVIAGNPEKAQEHAARATKLLNDVLAEHPDHLVARARLASQHALVAGLLRDAGKSDEALARYDRGIELIDDHLSDPDAPALVHYHGALVLWQRAKMIGFRGQHTAEITQLERAIQLLENLLSAPFGKSRTEQINRHLGYLYGDLGHAAESAKQTDPARRAFARAVDHWKSLSENRPDEREYAEALDWNRQRFKALPQKP